MGKRKYDHSEKKATKRSKNELENTEESKKWPQFQNDISTTNEQTKMNMVFDIKHFRKELATKQGQTVALTQFLQVCLNPDSGVDYMLEYLNSGGNSHEILRQISQENKKNLTLATPAFHLFHLIILKVQSTLPHMIAITEEACRYFLNTFMPTVEIMISENSGPRHRKIILKLLTSMVTLNPDLGVEILNQAPLTPKHLQYIVEKINYKEKDNVRVAFVHFMTSFLVDGHLPLIKALLEKQGLLSLVIPGLVQDDAEAVLMFLHILKKNVIDNTFVSKSLKLKMFSHQVIHNIFKLYNWKGPSDIKHEVKNEPQSEIMLLVSDILLTLFTSHKVGLYFVDNTLGTSDVNKNQNLYKALLTLKRPWENENQCKVILNIVHKCPDLHRAVINIIEQSFEPLHSPIWEKAVGFVLKLLDTLKPEGFILRLSELTSMQVAGFVRFITLPVPLLKFLQPNISNSDTTIALYCVKVLVKMLNSLKRYLEILEVNNTKANIHLKNKLETFFPKHLPGSGVLVSLIHKVITNNLNEGTPQGYRLPKFDQGDSLILLIDFLLHYQDIHPPFFEGIHGSLNINELLDFATNVSTTNISLLKFKIVSLWLALDNMAISLKNSMFKDLFLIMLEVYTNNSDNTWIVAKDTLYKFFKNTSIFETDEDEIHIMLYTLRNTNTNPAIIADLIEYVLINYETLTDSVRNQMVHYETVHYNNQDYINKLFDDLMENRNMDYVQFLENKVPSSFIIGSIQYVKENKDARKRLKQFLSVYIANLLHCNYSPEMTKVLTEDSKLDICSYIASWMEEPEPISELLSGKDNTLRKISISILESGNIECQKIFSDVNEENNIVDTSQLIMWAKYLLFTVIRLSKMKKLQSTQLNKVSEFFKTTMDICQKMHRIDICHNIIANIYKSSQVLDVYTPVDFKKDNILATIFLINVVSDHKDVLQYYNKNFDVLKPFKQKNYNEIIKSLLKIKKQKSVNIEHTIKALEVIGMNNDSDLNTINRILEIDAAYLIRDNKEPGLALEVLRAIIIKHSHSIYYEFPKSTVENIMYLYIKIIQDRETNANITTLELALIEYFENKPHMSKQVNENVFEQFFNCIITRKSTSQLVGVLLKYNSKFYNIFKEKLIQPQILRRREIVLPLGNVLLEQNKLLLDQSLLEIVYDEYKSNIFKMLEKPHKAGQLYVANWKFIRLLLLQCLNADDCVRIFNKNYKFEIVDISHISLFHAVFLRLCLFANIRKKEYLCNYFLGMLNMLIQALKEVKNDDVLEIIIKNIYVVYMISENLNNFDIENKEDFQKLTDSSIWQNFCKTVLKVSLKIRTVNECSASGPKLLSLLTTLVKLVYPFNHADIAQLFDMVTSHSEFLNVMLSHHSLEIKSRLVEFVYELIKKDNSVMKSQQIPVYLSSYHATRRPCDRLILTILHFYEIQGQSVNQYKPYVWGDSAANYYSVRKNRTSSLWGHPTPNQILNLLDRSIIQNTVKYFPVTQKLAYDYELPTNIVVSNDSSQFDEYIIALLDNMRKDEVFNSKQFKDNEYEVNMICLKSKYDKVLNGLSMELPSKSHAIVNIEKHDIYDPAFLFPLLSHLLTPGSIVSCFKLFRSGLLSVPVMALSSHCPYMRAAAYHILHRFSLQLETEIKHKNDRLLLTDFIETLRHSLPSAIATEVEHEAMKELRNPRLPAIDALYLARALMVATASHDPLYKPVNNFLIAKQYVDFATIPDFLTLFHDSDVASTDRRYWILDVIRDGTKTMTDVVVLFRTMGLKMIMDFYSSVLCDKKTKEKILSVLASIASIPRAADILLQGYGLMSWINCTVRSMKNEAVLVKALIEVIRNVVYSMHVNAFHKMLVGRKVKTVEELGDLKVIRDIETEVLIMLYDLLPCTSILDLDDFGYYLQLLNLLSTNVIKLLRKNQIINLINIGSERIKNPECLKLLSKSITMNNATLLESKLLCIKDNENCGGLNVKLELITIVKKYVLGHQQH